MKVICLIAVFLFITSNLKAQIFENKIDDYIWTRDLIVKNKISKIVLKGESLIKNKIDTNEHHIQELYYNELGLKRFMTSYTTKKGRLIFTLDTLFFSNSHQSYYDCGLVEKDLVVIDSCNSNGKVIYRQDYSCKKEFIYKGNILLRENASCDIGEGAIIRYAKEYIYDKKNKLIQITDYQEGDKTKSYNGKKIGSVYFKTNSVYRIKYSNGGFISSVKKYTPRNEQILIESTYSFIYSKAKFLTKIKVINYDTEEKYVVNFLYFTFVQ